MNNTHSCWKVIDMQINKHGIPIVNSNKELKQMRELQKLNFKEYAELIGYEGGIEITIVIPNHKPLVQAMIDEGWSLRKYSSGEIA